MERCILPPAGWYCTREGGHEGPCAAGACSTAATGWASPTLQRVYEEVYKLRAKISQPTESAIHQSLRDLLDAIELADTEMGDIA